MEAAASAISLVDASLSLLGKLKAFHDEYAKIPDGVKSIQADLESIKEAIGGSTTNAGWQGTRSRMNDLRVIKLRIEDVLELYNLEFPGQSSYFEGVGARVGDKLVSKVKRVIGPARSLPGYLKEIKDLSAAAKERMQSIHPLHISQAQQAAGHTARNEQEDFYHDNEVDPVGLEAPRKELVQMLSDATLLRVVAISSPDASGSKLAKAAYEEVQAKEGFAWKAWVTASQHDYDGKRLLKDILDGLGHRRQRGKSVSQLTEILKNLLQNKRYIIGIDSLETTRYWDDVLSAFPDDNMSSRIIIITTHDEIAQTCRKNCQIYWMQGLDTRSFEAPEAELVQILCQGTERKRRVVTISGPGGSGKSTLAKAAYNQVQIDEEFQYKAWGMASHDDGKDLLLSILRQLGENGLQEENSLQLINILKDLLLNGRYIIVIDGLETTGYWNNVLSACPDNNKSNRIIVTTTSNRVTNFCQGDGPVYKMQPLDKSSAKDLLERKVMFHRNICPANLDIGLLKTMILETCEYLPLAIANMGDYMRSLKKNWDYDECVKYCIGIGSLMINDKIEAFRGMNHVLNRSYTSLSANAKACLLSLGIYSKNLVIENYVIKDHVIRGKPLIRRLVAEKLISPADNFENDFFAELIEHNFIVPVEVSISGQVKTFRVNRMMPLFIDGKGDYENYVNRIDIQQGKEVEPPAYITRLYLHNSNVDSPRIGEKVGLSHVRLITFHGEASKALMDFNDYTFLRVLILENCRNVTNEHLTTICRPRLLRYLSIRGNTDVSKLPNIVKMRSLETLDTRDTKVQKIPMDVILLPKLLHLFGTFQITFTDRKFLNIFKVHKLAKLIPDENPLSQSKLQTLAGFLVDEITDFVTLLPRMPMLGKVRILCGQTAPNEKVIHDLLESLKTCLQKEVQGHNSPLHSLIIDFRGRHLNFLEHLEIEPPCLLRSLKLCGQLKKLPQFILSLSDSLEELCLSGTNLGGSDLLKLHRLKKLQFLKLTGDSFELPTELTFERDWFCSLLRLCFIVPKVPKIVIKKHAMKGLKSLQLVCNELGGVSGILHLEQLTEVILSTKVDGAGADDLLQQVSKHSMKPKLLYADGSRRAKLLSRTQGFNKGAPSMYSLLPPRR